jgi:hypothetical protein
MFACRFSDGGDEAGLKEEKKLAICEVELGGSERAVKQTCASNARPWVSVIREFSTGMLEQQWYLS